MQARRLCCKKNDTQNKLKQLKQECTALEAELDCYKNQTLETKTDEGQYNNAIQKCVMGLMGEYDVPSTKCATIIRHVSQCLHNKDIPLSELPCPNTCVNMLDRAQVLSKYQLTESMVTSKSWDMHYDGTTRDHNKILGHQVNLESGKTLSAGFTPLETGFSNCHAE